jgi:hypothetical protein
LNVGEKRIASAQESGFTPGATRPMWLMGSDSWMEGDRIYYFLSPE